MEKRKYKLAYMFMDEPFSPNNSYDFTFDSEGPPMISELEKMIKGVVEKKNEGRPIGIILLTQIND